MNRLRISSIRKLVAPTESSVRGPSIMNREACQDDLNETYECPNSSVHECEHRSDVLAGDATIVCLSCALQRGRSLRAQDENVIARLQELADRAKMLQRRFAPMIEQLWAAEGTGDEAYLDLLENMLAAPDQEYPAPKGATGWIKLV